MTKPGETIEIGRFFLNPSTLELSGPDGVVPLRTKSSEVLAVLARAPGTLVTKDRLMEEVWPGTFVTDDSLVQCVSEIRKVLGPGSGAEVVTVKGRGYRLELEEGSAPQVAPPPGEPVEAARRPRRRRPLAAGLVAALVLLVAGAAAWLQRPAPRAEESHVLAVLPFRNEGPESDGYFADGVAEDLIVALSQVSDLRVVSRGTSFSAAELYSGPREVAGALGADVVLEGSVRRLGGALHLTAALVEGETGANLWAEKYEGEADDIFRFQEEVLDSLVTTLSVRLSKRERARLGVRGTADVKAHDAYLRARDLENRYVKRDNFAAERVLKQAIRRDPEFALAHAHMAQVMSFRVENRWSETPKADVAAAFAAARRAVELDPDLPFAHFTLGRLYTRSYAHEIEGATERAIEEFETSIRLDPNYVDGYVFLAIIHIFDGHADLSLPLIAEGFSRNPIPPFWYHLAEGMARYFLGEYEAALAALETAIEMNSNAPHPHRFMMATLGQMGRGDDAEWAAMEYESLGLVATVSDIIGGASVHDPGYREIYADGLRKAGLPEE